MVGLIMRYLAEIPSNVAKKRTYISSSILSKKFFDFQLELLVEPVKEIINLSSLLLTCLRRVE
jgi:hypothetical protein